MTDPAITPTSDPSPSVVEAVDLEKAYGAGLGALLGRRPTSACAPALSGVSLCLPAGGSLAVVGRNGAGKSTLLRLLAGTARPTRGSVRVQGRIGLLLDLGAGLVDEMSGADNAMASLRLLGLSGSELLRAFDFVGEFAQIGAFLDEPVRVYSQGMRLRLAYATAIAPAPDVLITDEVLAVGDEAFQRKCSRHMLDFVGGGGTLVLATHNLYLAEKLCETAVWLDGGRERAVGPCGQVAKAYRDSLAAVWATEPPPVTAAADALGEGHTRALGVVSQGEGPAGGVSGHVRIRFEDSWQISVPAAGSGQPGPRWVEIDRPDGAVVARVPVQAGAGTVSVAAESLLPGRYRLRMTSAAVPTDAADPAGLWLECIGARRELGSVLLRHRWGADASAAGGAPCA